LPYNVKKIQSKIKDHIHRDKRNLEQKSKKEKSRKKRSKTPPRHRKRESIGHGDIKIYFQPREAVKVAETFLEGPTAQRFKKKTENVDNNIYVVKNTNDPYRVDRGGPAVAWTVPERYVSPNEGNRRPRQEIPTIEEEESSLEGGQLTPDLIEEDYDGHFASPQVSYVVKSSTPKFAVATRPSTTYPKEYPILSNKLSPVVPQFASTHLRGSEKKGNLVFSILGENIRSEPRVETKPVPSIHIPRVAEASTQVSARNNKHVQEVAVQASIVDNNKQEINFKANTQPRVESIRKSSLQDVGVEVDLYPRAMDTDLLAEGIDQFKGNTLRLAQRLQQLERERAVLYDQFKSGTTMEFVLLITSVRLITRCDTSDWFEIFFGIFKF
jgi:hypothetical protein